MLGAMRIVGLFDLGQRLAPTNQVGYRFAPGLRLVCWSIVIPDDVKSGNLRLMTVTPNIS
jgi:hypothetical protein